LGEVIFNHEEEKQKIRVTFLKLRALRGKNKTVIPAQAGIHTKKKMDTGLRQCDEKVIRSVIPRMQSILGESRK